MRADYVLPSAGLKYLQSGVFWPAPGEALHDVEIAGFKLRSPSGVVKLQYLKRRNGVTTKLSPTSRNLTVYMVVSQIKKQLHKLLFNSQNQNSAAGLLLRQRLSCNQFHIRGNWIRYPSISTYLSTKGLPTMDVHCDKTSQRKVFPKRRRFRRYQLNLGAIE
jgi:hypothetical protein